MAGYLSQLQPRARLSDWLSWVHTASTAPAMSLARQSEERQRQKPNHESIRVNIFNKVLGPQRNNNKQKSTNKNMSFFCISIMNFMREKFREGLYSQCHQKQTSKQIPKSQINLTGEGPLQ